MLLGIPSVIGPLSEWMDTVPVEGCWSGATIVLQTDDPSATIVATGISIGGNDLVPVLAGTQLKAGQRLVASQTLNGSSSDFTPSQAAVAVSASPVLHKNLPAMAFRSRLYACGTALWLEGAEPGAMVTVSVGGMVIGTGRASSDHSARIHLTSQLPPAGTTVSAAQTAPPGFPVLTGTPNSVSNQTIPLPLGTLPTPTVNEPLPLGCQSMVVIGGVLDGADVTVTRARDGSSQTATFDLESLSFQLSTPFDMGGDKISVSQAMPNCREVRPSDFAFAEVRPAEPPAIEVEPPCAGSVYVHVNTKKMGSSETLVILVDGREPLQYQFPKERSEWDVLVPALPSNVNVTVTVSMCGLSTSATVAVVDEAPPPAPSLADRLFACGLAVSVNTRRGSYLELWADLGNGPTQISHRVKARQDLETIDVLRYLTMPESVWVHQLSCGGAWLESAPPVDVEPHPRLDPLELYEPFEYERAVFVTNAVSGAHVTVWAATRSNPTPVIIGYRNITNSDPVVTLNRRLSAEDIIWAAQEMCGESSRAEVEYEVTAGTMRFLLPSPMEWLSGESQDGKVIVHSAMFACRFTDGAWALVADVENTESGYDCSIVLGVKLTLPNPLSVGESIDVDVAAKAGLPQGLASLGYPSHWICDKSKTNGLLRQRAAWFEILKSSATWNMVASWTNYETFPGKPGWVTGLQAPPDYLNEPFPPLRDDGD